MSGTCSDVANSQGIVGEITEKKFLSWKLSVQKLFTTRCMFAFQWDLVSTACGNWGCGLSKSAAHWGPCGCSGPL